MTAALVAILIGVLAMATPHHREGVPMTVEQRVVALLGAAADDVSRMAGNAMADLLADPANRSASYRESRAAELSYALRIRLARMGANVEQIMGGPASEAALRAALRADRELGELGLGERTILGSGRVGFVNVNIEAVEVIARDTAAREVRAAAGEMVRGIEGHARNAETVFRSLSESVLTQGRGGESAVNQAVARGIITGDPRITERAIRELFADPNAPVAESYRKLGNRQITVGKATMSVRQYAATVTRTRMREATVTAHHERLQTLGVSLVQVTGRESANFCTAFLNLVCSLNGFAGEIDGVSVVPLASLPGGGPPFHPNCSKSTAAFVPNLVSAGRVRDGAEAFRVFEQRRQAGDLLKPFRSA